MCARAIARWSTHRVSPTHMVPHPPGTPLTQCPQAPGAPPTQYSLTRSSTHPELHPPSAHSPGAPPAWSSTHPAIHPLSAPLTQGSFHPELHPPGAPPTQCPTHLELHPPSAPSTQSSTHLCALQLLSESQGHMAHLVNSVSDVLDALQRDRGLTRPHVKADLQRAPARGSRPRSCANGE